MTDQNQWLKVDDDGLFININKSLLIVLVKYYEMAVIKPLKLEVYNAIVSDFNKLNSFSRKTENELKKKYKKLVHTHTFYVFFGFIVLGLNKSCNYAYVSVYQHVL